MGNGIDIARMDVLRAALFGGANVVLGGTSGRGKTERIKDIAALDGHDVHTISRDDLTLCGSVSPEGQLQLAPYPVASRLRDSRSPLLLLDHLAFGDSAEARDDLEAALASIFWERSSEGRELPRAPVVLVAYHEGDSKPSVLRLYDRTPLAPSVTQGALLIDLSDEDRNSKVHSGTVGRLTLRSAEEAGILRAPDEASRAQSANLLRGALRQHAGNSSGAVHQESQEGYLNPTPILRACEWRRWSAMETVLQHLRHVSNDHIAVLAGGLFETPRDTEIRAAIERG